MTTAWLPDRSRARCARRSRRPVVKTDLDPSRARSSATPPADTLPVTRTRSRRGGQIEDLALGAPEVVLAYVDGRQRRLERTTAVERADRCVGRCRRAARGLARRVDRRATGRCAPSSASRIRSDPASPRRCRRRKGAGIQVVMVTGDHPQHRRDDRPRGRAGCRADRDRRGAGVLGRRATWQASCRDSTSWPARRPSRSCASCAPRAVAGGSSPSPVTA